MLSASLCASADAATGEWIGSLAEYDRLCTQQTALHAAREQFLALAVRDGWSVEVVGQPTREWPYRISQLKKAGLAVEVATPEKTGPAFCRFKLAVPKDEREAVPTAIKAALLKRAAVLTLNPYKFASGVGSLVEIELVPVPDSNRQPDASRSGFVVTYSTSRRTNPF